MRDKKPNDLFDGKFNQTVVCLTNSVQNIKWMFGRVSQVINNESISKQYNF